AGPRSLAGRALDRSQRRKAPERRAGCVAIAPRRVTSVLDRRAGLPCKPADLPPGRPRHRRGSLGAVRPRPRRPQAPERPPPPCLVCFAPAGLSARKCAVRRRSSPEPPGRPRAVGQELRNARSRWLLGRCAARIAGRRPAWFAAAPERVATGVSPGHSKSLL